MKHSVQFGNKAGIALGMVIAAMAMIGGLSWTVLQLMDRFSAQNAIIAKSTVLDSLNFGAESILSSPEACLASFSDQGTLARVGDTSLINIKYSGLLLSPYFKDNLLEGMDIDGFLVRKVTLINAPPLSDEEVEIEFVTKYSTHTRDDRKSIRVIKLLAKRTPGSDVVTECYTKSSQFGFSRLFCERLGGGLDTAGSCDMNSTVNSLKVSLEAIRNNLSDVRDVYYGTTPSPNESLKDRICKVNQERVINVGGVLPPYCL
jgi:hypothetical protein